MNIMAKFQSIDVFAYMNVLKIELRNIEKCHMQNLKAV